jgi:hypothetical protein
LKTFLLTTTQFESFFLLLIFRNWLKSDRFVLFYIFEFLIKQVVNPILILDFFQVLIFPFTLCLVLFHISLCQTLIHFFSFERKRSIKRFAYSIASNQTKRKGKISCILGNLFWCMIWKELAFHLHWISEEIAWLFGVSLSLKMKFENLFCFECLC